MSELPFEFTDHSISSATGASQTLLDAKSDVRERFIQNIAATDWWINPTGGTAAANTQGCVKLASGDVLRGPFSNRVTGIGTAASKLTVLEG